METRLLKFQKKRRRRLYFGFICSLCFLFFSVGKIGSTYSWFVSETSAMGEITNATTSDLLNYSYGEVEYLKNCKVKSNVTVTNVSNVGIPITLSLLSKNNGKHSKSLTLSPGESFTSNDDDTDNTPHNCDATEITYHLYGFEGYINELVSIPLDVKKLKATIHHLKKDESENNEKDQTGKENEPQPNNNEENPAQPDPQPADPPTEDDPEKPVPQTPDQTPPVIEEGTQSNQPSLGDAPATQPKAQDETGAKEEKSDES